MSNDGIVIRPAQVSDTKKLLDIYSPYILNTAVTFEYDVPSTEQFKERILSITQKYPYILAQCGDEILGYAYASEFKSRAAYSCSAEVSIYIKQERRHMGIGKKALYRPRKYFACTKHLQPLRLHCKPQNAG